MKKLFVMLLCLNLAFAFTCGCDAKNYDVSSDSSSGIRNKVVYDDGMDYEEYNKRIADYWQTYEGTPPEHKKYIIYSTPLSGVKEGIANDPNTDIVAVSDATKLYFGSIRGCHIEQKPFTYIERKEYTDESITRYRTVEYQGKKYQLDYYKTETFTETYTFAGQEYNFVRDYDKYVVWNENQTDSFGRLTIRRDTGKVVDYESYAMGEEPKDDITPISEEEAREKIIQYIKDLCSEDVLEDYKVESIEIEKGNNGYDLYSCYYVGEYATNYRLYIWISNDGELLKLQVDYVRDIFEKAVEEYGMEAFDKAKAVLESAVEIPAPAKFYISFNSDGKLFLVATTNRSYPNDGCVGIHPMHYAVEIIK